MRAHKRIDKTPFWIPIDNLSKETRPYRFEMRFLCYEVDEMVHVMVQMNIIAMEKGSSNQTLPLAPTSDKIGTSDHLRQIRGSNLRSDEN